MTMFDAMTEAVHETAYHPSVAARKPLPPINPQAQALIHCVAEDMPLRVAVRDPDHGPSRSTAALRLRRFVDFYPAFAGAALFTMSGRMITNSMLRTSDEQRFCAPFQDDIPHGFVGQLRNAELAAKISPSGSSTLVYTGVECPRGLDLCGILMGRLR